MAVVLLYKRGQITNAQRIYLLGKLYEARQKTKGGQIGNANASKRSDQSGPSFEKGKTAEKIASLPQIPKSRIFSWEIYQPKREEKPTTLVGESSDGKFTTTTLPSESGDDQNGSTKKAELNFNA